MTSSPPRLKASQDVPSELREALVALQQEHVDPARLARVAERLGGVLDAPAASAGPGGLKLLRLPAKLFGLRLAIAGLSLGAAVAFWHRPAPLDGERKMSSSPLPRQDRRMEAAPRREPPAGTNDSPRDELVSRPDVSTKSSSTEIDSQSLERPPPTRPRRATRARTSRTVPQENPARDLGYVTPSESAAAEELAPPLAPSPPVPVTPSGKPPPSEVDLLYRARRAIHKDPRAALRLLDEHAALYERGILAAEREVLAIEALWKLRHTAAAERRLRRFKESYPDSIHLPRLEQAPR